MAGFRDIKRRARRDLHEAMKVPVLYLESRDATPIPTYARIHTKFEEVGEVSERDVGNAARHERIPSLIFMIEELQAAGIGWRKMPRTAIISVEPNEAYQIDNTMPPDDITITAHVTVLPLHKTVDLPVPEQGDG
jgi:hypothetical protein